MRSISMILAGLAAPSLALGASFRTTNHGLQKVIEMLQGMHQKAETDLHEEEVKFSSFGQWCTSSKAELSASIEQVTEEMDQSKNLQVAHEAKGRVAADEAEEQAKQILRLTNERAAKKAARELDHTHFRTVKADYATSIAAIEQAIVVLRAQPVTVAGNVDSMTPTEALMQIESSEKFSKQQKDLISLLVTGKYAPNSKKTLSACWSPVSTVEFKLVHVYCDLFSSPPTSDIPIPPAFFAPFAWPLEVRSSRPSHTVLGTWTP